MPSLFRFLICKENSVAQTVIFIVDDNEILLLLQEDKRLTNMEDRKPESGRYCAKRRQVK
jgi:hypothetical protein